MQEKRVESIREVDFSGLKVPFVAVYGHPDDFPDKYVARIYELDRATDTIMVKETLEEIEMDIKEHTAMTFIPRGDGRCAVSGGRLDVGGQQYEKCKGIQSNPGRNL